MNSVSSSTAAKPPLILCIDDADIALRVRKLLLASEGYNVLTANSGEYGLKLFYSFPLYHSCPEHDALKWLRPPVEAIWPILSIPLPPSPVHQRAPSGQLSGARCRPTRSNTKVGLPSEH